jgi:PAS domain S-box-containing protein
MKSRLKILLLEDNFMDAELIKHLLLKEISFFDWLHVDDKIDFLGALNTFIPDIILCDNSIPQFHAIDALNSARAKLKDVPFILVTGTVSEEFAAEIIRLGADDYLLKDRMMRLPAAVLAAVRKRKAEKEKKSTAQKLEQTELNYRTIFLKSPLAKWVYDLDTLRFLEVNDAALRLYGYSRQQFLQLSIKDIRPSEDIPQLLKDISKMKKDTDWRQGVWTHLKKDSTLMTVEITAHSIDYDNKKARMVIVNDITEKKRLQEDLLEQQRQEQRLITATALEAQEKERHAIGVELHDNVNQILVATSITLSLIRNIPEPSAGYVTKALAHLKTAIHENRKIAHLFVAPDMRTESLKDLLTALVKNMLGTTGIHYLIGMELFTEVLLNPEQKINIYRIAQEQCTNIVKYAKATLVNINLVTKEGFFTMEIRDNGCGANLSTKTTGIGLKNIKGRLSILGGAASIETSPGHGFSLQVRIPVTNNPL